MISADKTYFSFSKEDREKSELFYMVGQFRNTGIDGHSNLLELEL